MKKLFFLLLIICLASGGCIREIKSRTTVATASFWTLALPPGLVVYLKIGENVRFYPHNDTVENLNGYQVVVSIYNPDEEDVDLLLWFDILGPGQRETVPLEVFAQGPVQFCVTGIDGGQEVEESEPEIVI